jgi:hypothetical protein
MADDLVVLLNSYAQAFADPMRRPRNRILEKLKARDTNLVPSLTPAPDTPTVGSTAHMATSESKATIPRPGGPVLSEAVQNAVAAIDAVGSVLRSAEVQQAAAAAAIMELAHPD